MKEITTVICCAYWPIAYEFAPFFIPALIYNTTLPRAVMSDLTWDNPLL